MKKISTKDQTISLYKAPLTGKQHVKWELTETDKQNINLYFKDHNKKIVELIQTSVPFYVFVVFEKMTYIMLEVNNRTVRDVPRNEWPDELLKIEIDNKRSSLFY